MQLCNYAGMQVCLYAKIQVCKHESQKVYIMQVCKYTRMQEKNSGHRE